MRLSRSSTSSWLAALPRVCALAFRAVDHVAGALRAKRSPETVERLKAEAAAKRERKVGKLCADAYNRDRFYYLSYDPGAYSRRHCFRMVSA